jgi:hypothetical protein
MRHHQNILEYQGGRYLRVALALSTAAVAVYAWHEPPAVYVKPTAKPARRFPTPASRRAAAVDPKRRAASLWAWLLTGMTVEPRLISPPLMVW